MRLLVRSKLSVLCLMIFGFLPLGNGRANASPLCQQGSLADYINLNQGGGCQTGDLTFFRFSFSPSPIAVGGAPLATANDITVTPYTTASQAGFFISSPFFQLNNATQAQSATYFLGYSVDPPPIIIGEDLSLDPPFGDVRVTENVCANDVLVNNCAFGLQYRQGVTPMEPNSSVLFANRVPFVDLALQITMNASPGNPAGFDAIQMGTDLALTNVPEPASLLLFASGLSLFFFARLRYVRSN